MSLVEDALLRHMTEQVEIWQRAGDERWLFLDCYRLMTGSMLRAVPAGAFADAVWVDRLLRRFADYYFAALAQYEQQPAGAPAIWCAAHDAARSASSSPLQKLLLGVNAHINYDLVLALEDLLRPEWSGLDAAGRTARHADHRQVNLIIGQTVDMVQEEILAPLLPGLAWADRLLGPLDERLLSHLITGWREDVWEHTVHLLASPSAADRRRQLAQVEARALTIARRIGR